MYPFQNAPLDYKGYYFLTFQQETGKKFQFLARFNYMDTQFQQLLLTWQKPYLRDQDLVVIFQGKESRRYDTVKYAITSVSAKRAKVFDTPLGVFRYSHAPAETFFLNVQRIANDDTHFLIAEPWKAVADMIYSNKNWKSIEELSSDLRIDIETMQQSDTNSLLHIASYYASAKVRKTLSSFAKELQ